MIKPTVGRLVLYKPYSHERFQGDDGSQRWPAIVTNVWSDTCINIAVFDPNDAAVGGRTSVMLAQDDQPPQDGWAEWMPYQKGQAAKTEELERAAALAKVPGYDSAA